MVNQSKIKNAMIARQPLGKINIVRSIRDSIVMIISLGMDISVEKSRKK
jgi:hypothetical protein